MIANEIQDDVYSIISQKSDINTIYEELLLLLKNAFGIALFINANNNKSLNNIVNNIYDPTYNISLDHTLLKNKNCVVVPILSQNNRIGTIVVSCENTYIFTQQDINTIMWLSMVISVYLSQIYTKDLESITIAKNAISTLSYSELEAAICIFNEIEVESLIIIGKFANKHGFSRSVVGNAISKLSSASVIKSRSLGTKGTNIKIINENIVKEIRKIGL